MSNPIFGFWKRTSDIQADLFDELWIGENGRIVHRINYQHGPYVMILWSARAEKDIYEVKLKPKSEPHRLILVSTSHSLSMEHLDLINPKFEFEKIGENQISSLFKKDLAWAARTMDKLEKLAELED
jgi:hypothetical protein